MSAIRGHSLHLIPSDSSLTIYRSRRMAWNWSLLPSLQLPLPKLLILQSLCVKPVHLQALGTLIHPSSNLSSSMFSFEDGKLLVYIYIYIYIQTHTKYSKISVFTDHWKLFSGFTEHVENPCDFFSGRCVWSLALQCVPFMSHQFHEAYLMKNRLGNVEYLVCRDAKGDLHAFHNACRHRAALLVSGKGSKSCFSCPYHVIKFIIQSMFPLFITCLCIYTNSIRQVYACVSQGWTYGLNGSLLNANRMAGIQNFNKDV